VVNFAEGAGAVNRSINRFRFASPLAVLVVIFLAVSQAACSGSSSSSRGPVSQPDDGQPPGEEPPEEQPSIPTLSFSAAPTTVELDGSTTLTWDASDASLCDASGAWDGSRSVSGSETVGPISSDAVFRLSCSGEGGGVSREVAVRVADDSELAVNLTANPEQIGENDSTTLSWSAQAAESCSSSGGWSGDRPPSGTFETGPLGETTTFSLSCANGSENALVSVTVEVLDKTIRWHAPTQNEDGSPLTDLGGYVVYWGRQSRDYTNSYTIDSPSITEWEADIAPGRYYFAMTAFDGDGNESDYSNELLKVIPPSQSGR
jgi:hypothetical protein